MKALKQNKAGSPYILAVKIILIRYEIKRLIKIVKGILGLTEVT
jgi:hypothetical protein